MGEYPVTTVRINKYLALTEKALNKVSIIGEPDSEDYTKAQDILEMVGAYLSDSKYFLSEGRGDDAFAAINYAHGWLDCGVRLGYLDGKGDWQLFTLSN
jgi:hypothetical protein